MSAIRTSDNVISLDFELAIYRKGCLHAYVNFESGYLTWRDSRQWCNNFTRTLSEEQIQIIRLFIDQCELIDQMTPGPAATDEQVCPADSIGSNPGQSLRSWLIMAQIADRTFHAGGIADLPPCVENLKNLIEKLCRVSFRI